tara:strand:+ start:219 stop:548 length:330 start_codon:yes stop_codon:yes gene_type:complete
VDSKRQVVKNIIASLLLILLLLPTALQFVSIFKKHEHTLCSEQQVHVHESTVKCEICSFHFTSSNYNLVQQNELEGLSISEKKPERNGSLLHHSFAITNIQLRGPPVLS